MSSSSSSSDDEVRCVVDRSVLNKHTFPELTDIGLSVFAPLCGKNRGAFVLDPPDGGTYGCAKFPSNFYELAGVTYENITDSNSIKEQYEGKNITAAEAVDLIDLYVKSVFYSSPGVDRDVMACDVNGLATLTCGATKTISSDKIRAVTLVGAFVPAEWATGGKALSLEHAKRFYTAQDFEDMKELGLNAVQIPVPLSLFATGSAESLDFLKSLLKLADDADLGAVIVLSDDTENKDEAVAAVKSASSFVAARPNVIALTVPESGLIAAARSSSTTLPLMVPTSEPELPFLSSGDPHIVAALDRGHTTSVADIASSSSFDDRNKLFYHEAVACQSRSPIEYAACYRGMPAYIVNGFNLAIDDCINKDSVDFMDYGQCGRFDETVDSDWWHTHRMSFASRQLAAFEQGVGWTFDAWKLYKEDPDTVGVMDSPAKLMTLKNVAAAGLFPSLTDSLTPAKLACLNPPVNDVAMGDDTLAPTAAPLPACDGGWWNFTTKNCSYWIPPPDPTPCPTTAPAPECADGGWWSSESQECLFCPAPLTGYAVTKAAVGGGAVAIVLGAIILKFCGRSRSGYTQIAELTV